MESTVHQDVVSEKSQVAVVTVVIDWPHFVAQASFNSPTLAFPHWDSRYVLPCLAKLKYFEIYTESPS